MEWLLLLAGVSLLRENKFKYPPPHTHAHKFSFKYILNQQLLMAVLNECPDAKSHIYERLENKFKVESEVCRIISTEFLALSCLSEES